MLHNTVSSTTKVVSEIMTAVLKCHIMGTSVCFVVSVPTFEDSDQDAPPILESEALSLLVGRMKGIQGHINSCYLDATLFRYKQTKPLQHSFAWLLFEQHSEHDAHLTFP